MGCSSYENINYDSNQKEDYLTAAIYESIKARKRAKEQEEYDKEQEEAQRLEKEYLRQQHLLESLETRGPKSYIDNLIITEIPKMKFGNVAPEEEIVKDLNNRDCEVYKEDEKDEDEEEKIDMEELKKEEEKNKNEIDELKRQIEEMNKKEEENKMDKKGKKGRKKGGASGFFKKNEDNKEGEENNMEEKKEEGEEEKEDEKEEEEKKDSKKEWSKEESKRESKKEGSKEESKKTSKKEGSKEESKKNSKKEGNLEESEKEKIISKLESMDEEKNSQIVNEERANKETDYDLENNERKGRNKSTHKKRKNRDKQKEGTDNTIEENVNENEIIDRSKKKKIKTDKMKELMELKAEKPPYNDKIKRYKYPKKKEQSENKLEFIPSPTELTMCVIGDENTGKTSFVRKYTRNNFEEAHQKTEKIEEEEIDIEIDSKNIKLKIIDTPPLSVRKNIKMIQEEGINKSHIVIYIVDINDEYAEFKVRLMIQSLVINEKQIIGIIGNKSDKVSYFSSKNREAIEDYCSIRKYTFEVISCGDTTQKEIEDIVNDKIINKYLSLYKE